jgi:DNA-binding MarR family transcriptional regulator
MKKDNIFSGDMIKSLSVWREIVFQLLQKNSSYNLSARQTLVLMTVYLSSPPHTVKNLSTNLLLSKPSVCRAIDALAILGMIKRKRDLNDKRVVNLQRTVKGSVYLSEFSEIIKKVSAKR